MAFLDSATDQYAILQLRRIEDTVYERFSSMRELERMGLEPDIDHYEVVYTAPLLPYTICWAKANPAPSPAIPPLCCA
ncbi:YodL domain-containing protein, partial [Streptococcus gordonii]|uniref:YodL domain-containing protein n=1 Tax=Streptococcus gordonii TaxID=1302 RepID=UPI002222518C